MVPKQLRRIVALVVAIASTALGGVALAQPPTNIELVIDDSGSMAQRLEGGRKIDIAKHVFSDLVKSLPPEAQVAVRTYGRREPSRARDCNDLELLIPFGPNSSDRVLPGVQALKPNGMTPIAASLEAAAKDFADKEGQNNVVVLLSDGEEDCNGDPCAAAKVVRDAGIGKFTVTNAKLMKSPYQEFKFQPVTAKYLKVKLLSSYGYSFNPTTMYEIRLMGRK